MTSPTVARAEGPGVAGGLAWLREAQRPDGLWGFDDRLVVRDSVEVLRAFAVAAPTDPSVPAVRETLLARAATTVDLEARLVEAMREVVPEPVLAVSLAELAAMRSRQGGWGITAGFETCDALDTALALRALVGTSYLDGSDLLAAVNCLAGLQSPDGGFGRASGEPSDLKTSAEVLRALSAVSRVGAADSLTQSLVEFLLGQQMADGGFPAFAGGATSDVRTTALVASALASSGANVAVRYPAARNYLLACQMPDGSWEESAYATALALLTVGGTRPDLIISRADFTPSLTPRGPDVELSIVVANLGLADAPPTVIQVFLGDPAAGGALVATASLLAMPAGALKTVVVTISTMLTVETSLTYFVVADGGKQAAESCETNNRAVATLEIANVPPPNIGNHAPVVVSSQPPIRTTTGATYTYQLVATDPDGDPLYYEIWSGPEGMTIDMATGLIVWPVNVPAGTRVTVSAQAVDPWLAGKGLSWSIDVVEPGTTWPPTIDSIPGRVAVVGQPYLYALEGTDPDHTTITYKLLSGPSGMVLNPATNVLSWTPTSADVGDHVVRVIAIDAQNETAEQQWTLSVEPASVLRPDLVPVSIDLSMSPTDPQSLHRDGAIVVTIANQGTAAASAFDMIMYEDRDGSGSYAAAIDRLLGTASVASLPAGQRADVLVTISGETLFRDNRVAVYLDPDNRIAELREDNNGDLSGNGTRFVSVPYPLDKKVFPAQVKWWVERPYYGGGYISPIAVGPLRDDNGDGRRDTLDTPEIVAAGYMDDIMTAYDGKTGTPVWNVTRWVQGSKGKPTPTIGDADGDGVPEVYLIGMTSPVPSLLAFNADGSARWRTMSLLDAGRTYETDPYDLSGPRAIWSHPVNLVDLEGDGRAELVTPTAIVEPDGIIRCFFPLVTRAQEVIAADLDGDGRQEVIILPYVFRSDCSVVWDRAAAWGTNSGGLAIAQLDDDPRPEIVWTRAIGLWAIEHDGTLKWSALTPNDHGPNSSTYVSRPAVGDVDGDGKPEIVFNDRERIGAYEPDGTKSWFDASGAVEPLGSSPVLADLNGDGRLEIIVNDSSALKIFNVKSLGSGPVFSYTNRYGGIPVVADVDGDGHLEIVLPHSEPITYGGAMTVLGSTNWAPGPKVWNQFSYHITNIQADLRVPTHEPPSWLTHNTYRAQASLSHTICETCGDTGQTADLTASFIRVDSSTCPAQAKYTVRVGNGGGRGVPAGVKVRFAEAATGETVVLGNVLTTKTLDSGQFEDVSLTVPGRAAPIQIAVTVDPDQGVADGVRANNVHTFSATPCSQYDDIPPHFQSSPPLSAMVGRDWAYFPAAFDADGDAVTFTLTTAPVGMVWQSAGGALVWRPTSDQLGLQEVSLQASDGRGGHDVQSFLVAVTAPPLTEPPAAPPAANLVLDVITDKPGYGPGEAIAVTASIANQSSAGRTGVLRVELRDSTGLVLAGVVESRTILFTGATTQTITGTTSTGTLLAGPYAIVAVYDEAATTTTASAPFDVTGSSALSVSVTTEHSLYGANESVRIVGQMQNGSPNTTLDELAPKLTVLDAAQAVLAEKEFPAASLGPATQLREEMLFDTGHLPAGDYRVRFELRQSDVLVGAAVAQFAIVASTARGSALTGEIACNPGTVVIGASPVVTSTMTNVGNSGLSGLDVRLQIVDPSTEQVLREEHRTLDLAMGASTTTEASFATLGLLPKSYIARLLVTLGERSLLSVATELLVEAGPPPAVSIQVPACGTADVTPVFVVEGGAPPLTQARFLDTAAYDGQPVSGEGAHLVEAQVIDGIGRTATAAARFVIDRTPPAIALAGISDGAFYNTVVTPQVAIVEANLTESSIDLDGQPYAAGTPVSTEGSHTLLVTAQDCAGNPATGGASFTLDFTPPVVSIADVPSCTSAPGLAPTVTANEPVTWQQTLDGVPYESGASIADEGSHTLAVSGTDRAGNPGSASVQVLIDRTAPVVTVTGVGNGGAYNLPVVPLFDVADVNGAQGSATLNGQPFVSGTPVVADGTYQLLAVGQDCAGNTGAAAVSFLIDTVKPTVQISNLAVCADGPAQPLLTASDPNHPEAPVTLRCTLDDQLLAVCDGLTIAVEGNHTLTVVATDQAGNTASASASFTVDNTAPSVVIVGVADGQAYNTPVTPVVSITEANLAESSVTLNGAPFTSGVPISTEGSYVLSATASDCAGHSAPPQSMSFLVDTTKPEVLIDVPACAAGDVSPVITVTEANPGSRTQLLDGADYDGSPVTPEGPHHLVVTATDTAGNQGSSSADFLIDRTKPQVSITGVTNGAFYPDTVTPVIAISDVNLSASSVTLNGAPYASGTPITAMGAYTLAVTASDCAGNRDSLTVSFEIRPYQGAISQALVSTARVLLARECATCSPDLLRATLSGLAIPYEEADTRGAWLAKLRSGRFNQVVLFEPDPDEDTPTFKELNEAVWLGDGLLVIKSHPDAMPNLRESLGLDFNGTLSLSGDVTLLPPLAPAAVAASGDGVKLKLSGATAVGCLGVTCTGSKDIVAAYYGRGLGKVATLAWNTETSSSQQLYQTALLATAPAEGTPLLPGGLAQVKTTVRNLGVFETTYVVNNLLPAGASTWEATSRTLVLGGGDTSSYLLPLVLPQATGTHLLTAELWLGMEWAAGWDVLDTNSINVTVERSAETIAGNLVTALQALSLSGGPAAKRANAIAYLQAAAGATPSSAIELTLAAIANVRAITSVDVTAIRIDLARLLRSYELRWQP